MFFKGFKMVCKGLEVSQIWYVGNMVLVGVLSVGDLLTIKEVLEVLSLHRALK